MTTSSTSRLASDNNTPQATTPLIADYMPNAPIALQPTKGGVLTITQNEFLQRVNALSQKLPSAGFALNLCEDRFQFLVVFCALLLKGTTNLLPPNRQPLTLKDIAKEYGDTCYCIFDSPNKCDIAHIDVSQLALDITLEEIATAPNISNTQMAAIAFTSGSTGKPKAINKRWQTLATTAQLLSQRLLNVPTALVATVPPQHMYGLETSLLMVLQGNGIMHNSHPFFPADITNALCNTGMPSILISTPIHLRALIKSGAINSDTKPLPLQGVISATAPLPASLAEAYENMLACPLWEIYGCTEAGSMATRQTHANIQWELLEGFKLHHSTTDNTHPQVTASAPHLFEPAPLGDTIEQLDENHFLLGARHQDIINVGGKRASVADLNRQLLDIPGIEDGAIFLPPNGKIESRPAAFVVSALSEHEVRAALSKRIDATLVPRPIISVPNLPRNSTGKLTQQALQQLWKTQQRDKATQ